MPKANVYCCDSADLRSTSSWFIYAPLHAVRSSWVFFQNNMSCSALSHVLTTTVFHFVLRCHQVNGQGWRARWQWTVAVWSYRSYLTVAVYQLTVRHLGATTSRLSWQFGTLVSRSTVRRSDKLSRMWDCMMNRGDHTLKTSTQVVKDLGWLAYIDNWHKFQAHLTYLNTIPSHNSCACRQFNCSINSGIIWYNIIICKCIVRREHIYKKLS